MDRMCSFQKAAAKDLAAVYALNQDPAAQAACTRAASENRLHVLRVSGSDEIVGAAALDDVITEEKQPALLLRAAAVKQGVPGALPALVESCELIAKLRAKEWLLVSCVSEDIRADLLRLGFAQSSLAQGEDTLCRAVHQGCCCGG